MNFRILFLSILLISSLACNNINDKTLAENKVEVKEKKDRLIHIDSFYMDPSEIRGGEEPRQYILPDDSAENAKKRIRFSRKGAKILKQGAKGFLKNETLYASFIFNLASLREIKSIFLQMSKTTRAAAILFLLFIIASCNHHEAKVSNLEKYYTENSALHKELFDSLVAFCKTHQRDVLLKKSNLKETAIAFHIPFETNNYSPVFFDSSFVRHDPDPRKTGPIPIPLNVIKKFSETIYTGITADSTHVFFAEKWDVSKRLNTPGDSRVGIMVSADTSSSANCEKRISPNACLETNSSQ